MPAKEIIAAHRRSYRWTDEDMDLITRLAAHWGGVRSLPETEVIREAIRRCAGAEFGREAAPKKNPKKSRSLS